MQRKFYVFFAVIMSAMGISVIAQTSGKTLTSAATNNKKPLVKPWLGKITGAVTLDAEAAKQLIALPLRVADDKNIDYVISSYQLAYKRIGITEDEETGKTSPQSDLAAQRFTTTPLPPVWQKNIMEGLHSGEELFFFDIIVFDKKGRLFFAPELKITVR